MRRPHTLAHLAEHRSVIIGCEKSDLVEEVRGVLSGGADVVFDSVGNPEFRRSFEFLGDGGLVVLTGRSAGEPDPGALGDVFMDARRNLTSSDFRLGGHIASDPPELPTRLVELISMVAANPEAIPVTTYSFDDVSSSHAVLEAGTTSGKLVLVT